MSTMARRHNLITRDAKFSLIQDGAPPPPEPPNRVLWNDISSRNPGRGALGATVSPTQISVSGSGMAMPATPFGYGDADANLLRVSGWNWATRRRGRLFEPGNKNWVFPSAPDATNWSHTLTNVNTPASDSFVSGQQAVLLAENTYAPVGDHHSYKGSGSNLANATWYCFSAICKKPSGGVRNIAIGSRIAGTTQFNAIWRVWYNLATGVSTKITGSATVRHGMEWLGGDYWLCWAADVTKATVTGLERMHLFLTDESGNTSYSSTADPTHAVEVHHCQIEPGRHPTTPIKTTVAGVTRSAERYEFGGALLGSGSVTLAASCTPEWTNDGADHFLLDTADAGLADGVRVYHDGSANDLIAEVYSGSALVASLSSGLAMERNKRYGVAVSCAANAFLLRVLDMESQTWYSDSDASGAVPTAHASICIGHDNALANLWSGAIGDVFAFTSAVQADIDNLLWWMRLRLS